MQRHPTVPTMPSCPAPRRATTHRYLLTQRRLLPNEALFIEDLGAGASGRRAQRIREFPLLGLDRDPPRQRHGQAERPEKRNV